MFSNDGTFLQLDVYKELFSPARVCAYAELSQGNPYASAIELASMLGSIGEIHMQVLQYIKWQNQMEVPNSHEYWKSQKSLWNEKKPNESLNDNE